MTDFETIFLQKTNPGKWEQIGNISLNRGFLFGDGVFETMVMKDGKIRFSHLHQQRIQEGMRVLGLEASSLSPVGEIQHHVSLMNFGRPVRIRWNVCRMGFGKYTPDSSGIFETLILQRFQSAPPIKRQAYISREYFVPQTPWSHCKTLNALPYVLANRERNEKGMDEVVLRDVHGNVAEAGAANIFWEQNGVFYTPSLDCSCIAGVARRAVLGQLTKDGTPLQEGRFTPEVFLNAQRVFVCNVTGISYIQEIDGREFDLTRIDFLDRLFH